MSHQPSLSNGVPPQIQQQFNGINSSRDTSPIPPLTNRLSKIPASQLPPSIPANPSPITITQKMGQLSVNSNFSTSTPNQTLSNDLKCSAFSPIPTTQLKGTICDISAKNGPENANITLVNANQNKFEQEHTIIKDKQVQSHNNGMNQNQVEKSSQIQPEMSQNNTQLQNLFKQSQNNLNLNQHSNVGVIPKLQQQNSAPIQQPQNQYQQRYVQLPQTQVQTPQNQQFQPQQSQNSTLSSQYQQGYGKQSQYLPNQQQNSTPVHSLPNLQQTQFPAQNTALQGPNQRYVQPVPYQQNLRQKPHIPMQQSYNQFQQPQNNLIQPPQQSQYPQNPILQPKMGQVPQQYQKSNLTQQYQYQQSQPYQQQNIVKTGFGKLWGMENIDLLQNPNILPPEKLQAPQVQLGQDSLNTSNCNPDVFRCTITKIPESSSLLQKSRLPLGILIHPFKDLIHLPVIQCTTIVRCRTCRTYINPFVYFVDVKRWKCNLCYRVNELPEEFQYDPISKSYGDPTRRPEIRNSTIEYIAPAEYMLRPPQPAVYLFLLDISRTAIDTGYLTTISEILQQELANLPGDARTQVSLICFDSSLHFFAFDQNRISELIIIDINDVFLPIPDNLLINLKDNFDLIEEFLEQLPGKFTNTTDYNSCLGAALQVALKLIGGIGGRCTVFQANLPNYGPGKLLNREVHYSNNEVKNLNPANDFFKRLALEFSAQQISVDLFLLNNQYCDLATISDISRFSGGSIHQIPLYSRMNLLKNQLLERQFRRYLLRKIGFEAVMRIRCTRGLSIHTFHGNFFVRSTDLLSLPNINPDSGFGMQLTIDENLQDLQTVCFQAALLYTSSKGERRIRVHTLCLPVCGSLQEILHAADQQCIIGLLGKMAVDRSLQSNLGDAREAFINVAIDILSSYKLSINMGNTSGLLVPQSLCLLPLYISALLKFVAFQIGVVTRIDDRIKAMLDMKTKPLGQLIQMIYPDLYPIHNLDNIIIDKDEEIPNLPHLHLSARILERSGAYLMDKGDHMIIMICSSIDPLILYDLFGYRDYNSIPDNLYELPILDNLNNQRLHHFINYLNDEKPYPATLHIIRDNSALRVEFYERFIEDRVENALSYHEFLQHLKMQIK